MINITLEGPPKVSMALDPAAIIGVRIMDRAAMVRDYAAVDVLVMNVGWVMVQQLDTFEHAQGWVEMSDIRNLPWMTRSL